MKLKITERLNDILEKYWKIEDTFYDLYVCQHII